MGELKKRSMECRQYRMYGRMLKVNRPAVTLLGEAMTVEGIAAFLGGIGFPAVNKLSAHSLRLYESAGEDLRHIASEKERMDLMQGLHHQLVLVDDVMKRQLPPDNTYLRIACPVVDGAVIATHMPLMGPRGADWILESLEEYLQTL